MTAIEIAVTIGDLNDEAILLQPRQALVAGDDVRLDGAIDERQPVLELRFPELLAPLDEIVAAPDVVDEDVELTHLLEQFCNLIGPGVIALHGDTLAPSRGDDVCGLIDGLRPVFHAGTAGNAAARAIYGRAGFTECGRDAAPGTACGTCHDGDLARQGFHLAGAWTYTHASLPDASAALTRW